eukprot:TRINITY_DN22957_c0_g1_i1.p2 TRINITY_DN22957_c0_g1~~TRINITY_DN22957_c0_g1_i1.p2  ORF type:complete len:203 (+),score=69.85 TRINITY_DN22957_c0_g1_i1:49-657(+)
MSVRSPSCSVSPFSSSTPHQAELDSDGEPMTALQRIAAAPLSVYAPSLPPRPPLRPVAQASRRTRKPQPELVGADPAVEAWRRARAREAEERSRQQAARRERQERWERVLQSRCGSKLTDEDRLRVAEALRRRAAAQIRRQSVLRSTVLAAAPPSADWCGGPRGSLRPDDLSEASPRRSVSGSPPEASAMSAAFQCPRTGFR